MVSEDSDQIVSRLLAIHHLSDLCDIRKTVVRLMNTSINHLNTTDELFKIPLL